MKIYLSEILKSQVGVTEEDGERVFDAIKKRFEEEKEFTVSFFDIDFVSINFLNKSFGVLYKEHNPDEIKRLMKVSDITTQDKILLRKICKNAKKIYLEKSIDSLHIEIDEIINNVKISPEDKIVLLEKLEDLKEITLRKIEGLEV